MRILIDLQGAQNGSRHRGIGRYSLALAKAIARNAGEHQTFILLNAHFSETIDDIIAAFSGVLTADHFLVFASPGPVAELSPENTWRRRVAEILREYVIASLSPDVVLITSMIEGTVDDTVTSCGSIRSPVSVAAVIYDLIPLTDPDRYIGWEPAKRWYHSKLDSLCRADLLFAISDATMNDAIRMLHIEQTRIENISSAADESFSAESVAPTRFNSVAKRLGIVRKYLMHSSAYEARKNFEGLIRSFATLPRPIRSNYQLVLVCKLDGSGREALTSLAANAGLTPTEVVLTGFVPDEDLVSLYANCYLFVFPSFHEGFGLPALEAMCCGAATIGSRLTSVPEVIGREDALFDPASDGDMAALILKSLTDTDFYRSLKSHARLQASRFSWDRTALRAIAGMERLGVRRNKNDSDSEPATRRQFFEALADVAHECSPSDLELLDVARSIDTNDNAVRRLQATAAFNGTLTWRIEGPFDSSYSLALLNRETARALTELGHTVILHSTDGPGDYEANRQFLELNPDLEVMHRRAATYPHELLHTVSRNLYPPRVADMHGNLNLLHHYAWEESGIPSAWVADFNSHLDGITCLSNHVEKVLLDNGVRVPMTTTGAGVDHWERIVPTAHYQVKGRSFRFLHVSSCFPRKGIDALLDAFGRAFTDDDDVSLIIKTFANPHNEVGSQLSKHRAENSNYPHVLIIEDDLRDSDLKALYRQCHAMVIPSRAEGFGLPLAEAMLSGLPAITTAWSGQLDFCNEQTAWLIDYKFERAQTHFGLFDSVWAEVDVAALAEALIAVHVAPLAQRNAKARAGRELLLRGFKWSDVAARLVVSANSFRADADSFSAPRVGWITTWNTKCGIASYSQHLLSHFPLAVTVFAPDDPVKVREDEANCVRAWRSGKDENLFGELESQIDQRGNNTVVLQFNYGLYNFRELSRFLCNQVDDGRAVIVMMHATDDPGLLPVWNWSLAELVPALARCSRVLVHSIADLNRLKQLGLVRNVAFFPHGILEALIPQGSVQPGNSLPLIATYGFCLPHKGLLELVAAIGLLRDQGIPTRLRLVNAEYPVPISAEIVSQISQLVRDLALDDLVERQHGFLGDEEALGLLQDADLIVFPYQQTNESASGAVRFGLAARKPVAVTPIPIFDDLGEAVHRLPGTTPRAIANGIAAILSNLAGGTETSKIANAAERWRQSHGYAYLGARLHGICTALARSTRVYERVFDGSSRQLRSDVGRITGRSITSTGAEGYLIFGLFLALSAGRYRIIVNGSHQVPAESTAYCEVFVNAGSQLVRRIALIGNSTSQIANFAILLANRCKDLEIRVAVDKRTVCRVDQLRIRSNDYPPAVESGEAVRDQ